VKTLYLRIYLTVLAVLLLFALAAGWLAHSRVEQEIDSARAASSERMAAWAELIENSLPEASASTDAQREALLEWATRLRLPLALDNAQGQRIATSPLFERRQQDPFGPPQRVMPMTLSDGRVLSLLRPEFRGRRPHGREGRERGEPGEGGDSAGAPDALGGPPPPDVRGSGFGPGHGLGGHPDMNARPGLAEPVRREARRDGPGGMGPPPLGFLGNGWAAGSGLLIGLVALFLAVAAGAYPVVRRLTRRLETLRRGVEAFGQGDLAQRVDERGQDEVATVAASFNRAAERIESLVRSNRSLLANASHELRSPLTRLKMAVSMLADTPPERAQALKQEIDQDIRELDALVEEVLLASRLDAETPITRESVDLLALALEEGTRAQAEVDGEALSVLGDERLLRRALRNLLDNARRYGGDQAIRVTVGRHAARAWVHVDDEGPGVPEDQRERIFEAFYRLPGHAEMAGGVGLGLSLVRQIARRHGGDVRCEARTPKGSRFVIELPLG
jgi:signal transduction histidine kinase